MTHRIATLAEKPELEGQVDRLTREAWPEFLLHAHVRHWGSLFNVFAGCQILLCDDADTVVAVGHTIPFTWDGTADDLPPDMNTIMERAMSAHNSEKTPTTLSALAAIVGRPFQRQGLSSAILSAMKKIAANHDLSALVAPVRPTLKSLYPLTPIERYVQWERADGSPFDPWLRVHWRFGAERLRIMPQSMVVTGTVTEWEEWTGLRFPETGVYVVPGALQPVTIDLDRNLGHYEDPNVWMRHSVGC